jgi:hypothetical protein
VTVAKKPDPNAPPKRPRPPNEDDAFVDALRESCARAMATWLKDAVNTQREIRSLKLPEMMGLAEACTAHWIVQVSKRLAEDEMSPKVREYTNLLLG